jgi:DNA-directed RNA polymerase specialized sigma24 family protein
MGLILEILPIAAAVISAISAVVKFLDSVRTNSAEKSYTSTLASERLGLSEKLRGLLEKSRTDRPESDIRRELSENENAELEKLLVELQALTEKLPPKTRKVVLEGLMQASDKGRIAYAAKLLTQANAGIAP